MPAALPITLTIGGLDPSCGAGIGADLRAMHAAGVWGCAVCAALTVQSTRGLRAVRAVPTSLVAAQVEELFADMPIRAVKTGALGSAANARWVASFVRSHPDIAVVVDPVLRATRGPSSALGLCGRGSSAAMAELAEVPTVLTPNIAEAEVLLGRRIADEEQARDAARALVRRGARAVLLKGGHLPSARADGRRWVVDWLAVGDRIVRLAHRRRKVGSIHGTGCVLSAFVAARLAGSLAGHPRHAKLSDDHLVQVVRWATRRLAMTLQAPSAIGSGLEVLSMSGRKRSRMR